MPPGMASRAKGPLVFLDYDQDEIELPTLNPLGTKSGRSRERNAQMSAAAIARLERHDGLPMVRQRSRGDVYATKRRNAPMNVFFHGGAWRRNRSADSAYLSETFVDFGAHFLAVDFNNASKPTAI